MFGLIQQFKNEVFNRISGLKEIKLRETIHKVKSESQKRESAVSTNVSRDEFKRRYRTIQLNIMSYVSAFAIFSYIGINASSGNFIVVFMSIYINLIMLVFYFFANYELWRARLVANKWMDRFNVLTTTKKQYLLDIIKSPSEFFPKGLKFNK